MKREGKHYIMDENLKAQEKEQAKKYTGIKIFFWVFLFPIMLLIATGRAKKIPAALKEFLLVLQLVFWGAGGFVGYRYLSADAEPPVITPISISANYGADISVRAIAVIADNKDEEPVMIIESSTSESAEIRSDGSSILFHTAGDFMVTVSAEDASGNRTSADIAIRITDNTAPEIILKETKEFPVKKEIPVIDIASVKDEVDSQPSLTITACSDGGKISADGKTVTFDRSGIYTVGLMSSDAYGNTSKNTASVTVQNTILPELTLSEKEIMIDESVTEIRFEDYAEAKSEVYGDLTENITIDFSQVVYGKPGNYTVTYTVEDSDQHKVTDQLKVIIKDTMAPVILLEHSSYSFTIGDDIPDYKKGVRAEDANDGDLTDKVAINVSDINSNKAGSYEVIYTVADQAGNTAEERAAVVVKDKPVDRTAVDDSKTSGNQNSGNETSEQVMSYVVNKNTGVFHYPDCKSVSQIKPHNRMDFEGSREELVDKYRPCGNCHP